jgi:transposase
MISTKTKEDFLDLIRNGVPIKEAAKQTGIGLCTAYQLCRIAHIKPPMKDDKKKFLKLVKNGTDPIAAATNIGVSNGTARIWCLVAGLPFSKSRRVKKKKEFLKLIEQGINIKEAAEQAEISLHSAYNYCKETGTSFVSNPRGGAGANSLTAIAARKKWEGVDWTMRDTDIARHLGVTRERVRQVRKNRGVASPDHGQHLTSLRIREFLRARPEDAAKKTVEEMSKEFNCSETVVRNQLKEFGIKAVPNAWFYRINKDNLKSFCTINPRTGCWEIKGHGERPYPKFGSRYARHVVYEWFKGKIPKGLSMGSTCFNAKCVNPAHLYTTTLSELLVEAHARGR